MSKICGLSVNYPGAQRPLQEGAKLGLWDFVLLEGGRVDIPPADIFILAAWHPSYSQLLGLGKMGVLWTSSAGEMDFEPIESQWLGDILNDPRISFVWFGDRSLAAAFPQKGFYCPYPLDVSLESPKVAKEDIITLFCPSGPKKNLANQILAAGLVQREAKLTLHTNIQGYDNMLTLINHVKHPWLSQEEYYRLLAAAKVNLCCSWAETFNYQAAEAGLCGTASVTSPTIPVPGLVVENPNSPLAISSGILQIANASTVMGEKARKEVINFAKARNDELRQILKANNIF